MFQPSLVSSRLQTDYVYINKHCESSVFLNITKTNVSCFFTTEVIVYANDLNYIKTLYVNPFYYFE